jgi:hypothetical protein
VFLACEKARESACALWVLSSSSTRASTLKSESQIAKSAIFLSNFARTDHRLLRESRVGMLSVFAAFQHDILRERVRADFNHAGQTQRLGRPPVSLILTLKQS